MAEADSVEDAAAEGAGEETNSSNHSSSTTSRSSHTTKEANRWVASRVYGAEAASDGDGRS